MQSEKLKKYFGKMAVFGIGGLKNGQPKWELVGKATQFMSYDGAKFVPAQKPGTYKYIEIKVFEVKSIDNTPPPFAKKTMESKVFKLVLQMSKIQSIARRPSLRTNLGYLNKICYNGGA